MFTSLLRPFLDRFKFGACFPLSLTLHSLENLVTARCFPNFSAHLAKFSQLKFHKYTKNITWRNFPALRWFLYTLFAQLEHVKRRIPLQLSWNIIKSCKMKEPELYAATKLSVYPARNKGSIRKSAVIKCVALCMYSYA